MGLEATPSVPPAPNWQSKQNVRDAALLWGGLSLVKVIMVLEISPEKLERYRSHLAGKGLSDDRVDEIIHAVGHLMLSFVDRAWGTDPVQILERKRLKDSFRDAALHASLPTHLLSSFNAARVDLAAENEREGAPTPKTKKRGWRHESKPKHQSGHLLPGI